ncbi:MAG: MaoC family dehydratase, partial [Gammaproteobacteria bacterium]
AKTGPFGTTIAHGYLTLALVNRFLPEIMDVRNFSSGVNYGCNKVRFPAPLKVNSRIRGVGELVAAEEVKGGVQATVCMVVEVEGSDRPVCVAEVISRYFY